MNPAEEVVLLVVRQPDDLEGMIALAEPVGVEMPTEFRDEPRLGRVYNDPLYTTGPMALLLSAPCPRLVIEFALLRPAEPIQFGDQIARRLGSRVELVKLMRPAIAVDPDQYERRWIAIADVHPADHFMPWPGATNRMYVSPEVVHEALECTPYAVHVPRSTLAGERLQQVDRSGRQSANAARIFQVMVCRTESSPLGKLPLLGLRFHWKRASIGNVDCLVIPDTLDKPGKAA
ncbi:hypothetical protein LCGC14_2573890, partial [marine sediment metagenome]